MPNECHAVINLDNLVDDFFVEKHVLLRQGVDPVLSAVYNLRQRTRTVDWPVELDLLSHGGPRGGARRRSVVLREPALPATLLYMLHEAAGEACTDAALARVIHVLATDLCHTPLDQAWLDVDPGRGIHEEVLSAALHLGSERLTPASVAEAVRVPFPVAHDVLQEFARAGYVEWQTDSFVVVALRGPANRRVAAGAPGRNAAVNRSVVLALEGWDQPFTAWDVVEAIGVPLFAVEEAIADKVREGALTAAGGTYAPRSPRHYVRARDGIPIPAPRP